MEKIAKRDSFKAAMVQQTAKITGVSTRQVRRVINGTCKNEQVMGKYMELVEGTNKLLQAVRTAVPFEDRELVVRYYRGAEADRMQTGL